MPMYLRRQSSTFEQWRKVQMTKGDGPIGNNRCYPSLTGYLEQGKRRMDQKKRNEPRESKFGNGIGTLITPVTIRWHLLKKIRCSGEGVWPSVYRQCFTARSLIQMRQGCHSPRVPSFTRHRKIWRLRLR